MSWGLLYQPREGIWLGVGYQAVYSAFHPVCPFCLSALFSPYKAAFLSCIRGKELRQSLPCLHRAQKIWHPALMSSDSSQLAGPDLGSREYNRGCSDLLLGLIAALLRAEPLKKSCTWRLLMRVPSSSMPPNWATATLPWSAIKPMSTSHGCMCACPSKHYLMYWSSFEPLLLLLLAPQVAHY